MLSGAADTDGLSSAMGADEEGGWPVDASCGDDSFRSKPLTAAVGTAVFAAVSCSEATSG